MFEPNPVEFELPFEEGQQLQVRSEWIAEQKMSGLRALLEFGMLKMHHSNLTPPGPPPDDWRLHAFDGCVVDDVFYIFDVLTFDGEDTRMRPLFERRALLRSVKLPDWCRLVPCGKNIGEFLEAIEHDGGKGVVLKNLLDPYGKSGWIKIDCPALKSNPSMASQA